MSWRTSSNGLPLLLAGALVLAVAGVRRAGAHREHKVHNIVLYPDKHSWCRTTTIKQVISYPGCRSVEIDNNVCVGACFSYSIPHTEPSDPGEVIVPYCDSCQPSETTWSDVTLDCSPATPTATSAVVGGGGGAPPALSSSASVPSSSSAATAPPLQLVKRVQIITNCSCAPCERSIGGHTTAAATNTLGAAVVQPHHSSASAALGSSAADPETAAGALSYEVPLNDGPDLLNVLQLRNSTLLQAAGGDAAAGHGHAPAPEHLRQLMNNKIVSLLQRIQETNRPQDKQQLKELLQMIQDPEDAQPSDSAAAATATDGAGVTPLTWSDAAFAEFVERLDDEHVELDVPRLREVLHKFERSQAYKEYRRREQELEEQRLRDQHQQLLDKHHHEKALHHLERQLQNQPPAADTRSMADNFTNRTDEDDEDVAPPPAVADRIGGSSTPTVASSSTISSTTTTTTATTVDIGGHHHHGHVHQHQHHHHVVGEHVASGGRLAKGPHGALIIEPDVVVVQHERLDVSPTELKANHAGTMLSYGGAPPPGSNVHISANTIDDGRPSAIDVNLDVDEVALPVVVDRDAP